MADYIRRYTLRINGDLLDKLDYIAKADGRSVNKLLERLIKKSIYEYEDRSGPITPELIKDMKKNVGGGLWPSLPNVKNGMAPRPSPTLPYYRRRFFVPAFTPSIPPAMPQTAPSRSMSRVLSEKLNSIMAESAHMYTMI